MVTIGVNAKGIGQWVVGNSEDGVTRSGAAYPLGLRLWHLLQRTDVLNDRFAPAVDVRPGTVAYAVFVAGNVDHVAAAARAGYAIMRMIAYMSAATRHNVTDTGMETLEYVYVVAPAADK